MFRQGDVIYPTPLCLLYCVLDGLQSQDDALWTGDRAHVAYEACSGERDAHAGA